MSQGSQRAFPLARSENLITEEIGAEVVAYDGLTNEAHCLSPLAAVVFGASDGRTSVADLAGIATARLGEPVDVPRVEQALAELEERNLMVAPADGDGISRRGLVRKTAVLGGAAAALPLVTSVVTPAYGQATTPDQPSNLSSAAAAFTCEGGTIRVKWNQVTNSPTPPSECGTFAGECQLGGTSSLCTNPPIPPGFFAQETSGAVTFTFPATCTLIDYYLKCGSGCLEATDGAPQGTGGSGTFTTGLACPLNP